MTETALQLTSLVVYTVKGRDSNLWLQFKTCANNEVNKMYLNNVALVINSLLISEQTHGYGTTDQYWPQILHFSKRKKCYGKRKLASSLLQTKKVSYAKLLQWILCAGGCNVPKQKMRCYYSSLHWPQNYSSVTTNQSVLKWQAIGSSVSSGLSLWAVHRDLQTFSPMFIWFP